MQCSCLAGNSDPSFFLPQVASLQLGAGGSSYASSESGGGSSLPQSLAVSPQRTSPVYPQARLVNSDGGGEAAATFGRAAEAGGDAEPQPLCAFEAEDAVGAAAAAASAAAAAENSEVYPPSPPPEQPNATGFVHGDVYRSVQDALAASQQQVQELQRQRDAVKAELDVVSEQCRAVQEELELGRWVAGGRVMAAYISASAGAMFLCFLVFMPSTLTASFRAEVLARLLVSCQPS